MRQFLVTLLGILVLSVAACSGDDPEAEAPTTVLIAAEPEFAGLALEIAGELLEPQGLTVALADQGQEADITIGGEHGTGPEPFITGYWVVVTGLSHRIRNVSLDSVQETNGSPAFVSPYGDEWDVPLRETPLLLPDSPSPPLDEWGIPPQAEVMSIEEIYQTIAHEPDRIALLPLDAVDARVQSVSVGSSDVIFGQTLERDNYPLVERGWVSAAAPQDDPSRALVLQQTKMALAKRLGVAYGVPDPIILRATGDIIPARCVYAKQLAYGDFVHAFRDLGLWLSKADITVGSLDASISDAGRPFGCEHTFSLLAPAQSVEGLEYAGFDVITVATNHVKDCGMDVCGDQAFFDTLNNLQAAGIEPVGGGADLAQARAPVVIDVRGTTFAFLGADQIASYYHAADGVPGVAPLQEDYLREDVAAAEAIADVVVVLPQWGVEYTHSPTGSQRSLAAAAVDAGADLVVGNHPHWVQAVETISDAFVAYALGNFVFDQDWSVETQQGVALEAAFFGSELKGVRLVPIRIVDMHQPTFAEPEEAQQILDGIWEASAALP